MLKKIKNYLPYLAWITALIATIGSLYFSDVLKFPPCSLCWYQRITVYPMIFIILVGILKKDKNLPIYVLPITTIGWMISIYHNLLYYKILPNSAATCSSGISCTTKYIEYLGFITIPLLSFTALTIITVSMILYKHLNKKYE